MNENQRDLNPSADSRKIRSHENCIEWIESIHPDRTKGVALVIHGLNFQPEKMEPIITLLRHSCIDVLNLSLRGHGKNYTQKVNVEGSQARMETFKTVSYKSWIKETHQAYRLADKRRREKHVPLFLIGYSLGGLMGATLFASYQDVYFSRMVLLAPALHMYTIHYLSKFLSPFSRLVIPCVLIKSYCANRGTPVAAYNALFEATINFNQNITQKVNVPTIIFIDKHDEMVSYRKLKRIIKNGGLHQWKLHAVKKNTATAKEKMHHLIIDESSLGKDAWNKMKGLIIHHLLA